MNQISKDLITIRSMTENDLPFIYSTWLNGLYFGNPIFRQTKRSIYYQQYRPLMEAIMAKPNLNIKIVCLKEDPDVILAYSITQPHQQLGEILHWVFTRLVWRNMGIAKSILPDTITAVTHLTTIGKSLKPDHWVFYPYPI